MISDLVREPLSATLTGFARYLCPAYKGWKPGRCNRPTIGGIHPSALCASGTRQADHQRSCHPACYRPSNRSQRCRRPSHASQGHEQRHRPGSKWCGLPDSATCPAIVRSTTAEASRRRSATSSCASGASSPPKDIRCPRLPADAADYRPTRHPPDPGKIQSVSSSRPQKTPSASCPDWRPDAGTEDRVGMSPLRGRQP